MANFLFSKVYVFFHHLDSFQLEQEIESYFIIYYGEVSYYACPACEEKFIW